MSLIKHCWAQYGPDLTVAALEACDGMGLASANDVLAWADSSQGPVTGGGADLAELYELRVAKRSLSDYREVM